MTSRKARAVCILIVVGIVAGVSAVAVAAAPQLRDSGIVAAAERGDPHAQYGVGLAYFVGRGAPKDYVTAAKWLQRAAEQYHLVAQFMLGLLYDSGQGVPQDHATAARWYQRAADQGYADAQANLGALYDTGRGVPQDYVTAHMWLNLAAAQRTTPLSDAPGKAHRRRELLAAKMTPEQIAEAQRRAREWTPTCVMLDLCGP